MLMEIQLHKAVVVLADIGGYTRFVKSHAQALLHAEKIITELLESVIDAAEHPLSLNKLEGDAALFFAIADSDPEAVVQSALKQVAGFFKAFAVRRADLIGATVCDCSACQGIDRLTIKVIVHFGEVAFKRVRSFEELAGETVIVAHRLLKNSVADPEYILVTTAADRLAGGVIGTPRSRAAEPCEGIGVVETVVYAPPGRTVPPIRHASTFRKMLRMVALQFYVLTRRIRLRGARPFLSLAKL
jgi:class 3 adenylate cyclase